MGKLKPVGSEKLEGFDKINRILEISNYKLNIPQPINEDTSIEYKKTLVDGYNYHIVKEKNGYVIKKGLNESTLDYLEPIKNRKYYSSYSQALKRLNLVTKEVNVNEGFDKNISLFEGDDEKRYFLKMGGEQTEQEVKTPTPAPKTPTPAPAPAPAPEVTDEPEMELPEPEMELPEPEITEPEMETPSEEGDEEVVTFKTIQKLTGKLGQKIREFLSNDENKMSSNDIKYVINSVLSALDLNSLDSEDKEEIIGKFEGGKEEVAYDETEMMDDEEMDEPETELEMGEPEIEETYHNGNMKERQHQRRMEDMFEDIFTESKVDKVLKKYFKSETENTKSKLLKTIGQLSESYKQEKVSIAIVKNYPSTKLIGKTKKQNLVFQINEERIVVTPKGGIL